MTAPERSSRGTQDGIRLGWLERAVSDLDKKHDDLKATVDKISDRMDKIDRKLVIGISLIIGLGVGSKFIPSDVLFDLLKHFLGL